jgi:hypothetical protein
MEIMIGSDEDTKYQDIPTEEKKLERIIQEKGLTAPRLSPTMISETIVGEAFYVFPGTTLTICCLTLRNGFNITGESAAASPENFDEAIGRRIARDNARNKIWALEGYLLRQTLWASQPNPRPTIAELGISSS